MRYIPHSEDDRRHMLASVGASSIDELFADIPKEVLERFEPMGLPGTSEIDVERVLQEASRENIRPDRVISFQGGGVYDHHVPSVVRHLTSRSELYTAYTPYQPELSQGTLTTMFEFQTMVCELTGMEIANASMYDGASAAAEAILMAERVAGRGRVLVSAALFPHVRRVVDTYCWAAGIELVELPYDDRGRVDRSAISRNVSGLLLQTPNAFGVIEELDGLKASLGDGLLIASCHPLALALLEPPGTFGADIVVAEGQPLGLSPSFGGPLLGLLATRGALLRQMPGRIVSRTVDIEGETGYTMAAQTREQHIRRERATSNICTNSALGALAATIYLASLGEVGLRNLASLNFHKAHYAARAVCRVPGVEPAFAAPFFNEFTVRTTLDPTQIRERLRAQGILVDPPESLAAPAAGGLLRFAVTEKRTQEEIDRLAAALQEVT